MWLFFFPRANLNGWYCRVNLRYSVRTFDLTLPALEQQQRQQHTYTTQRLRHLQLQATTGSALKNVASKTAIANKKKGQLPNVSNSEQNVESKLQHSFAINSPPRTVKQTKSTPAQSWYLSFSGEANILYAVYTIVKVNIPPTPSGTILWLTWMFQASRLCNFACFILFYKARQ